MPDRTDDGRIVFTWAELRRWGAIVGLVCTILSAGVGFQSARALVNGKAEKAVVDSLGRIQVFQAGQIDRLIAMRDDVAELKASMNSVIRLVCAKATNEERHITTVQCPASNP